MIIEVSSVRIIASERKNSSAIDSHMFVDCFECLVIYRLEKFFLLFIFTDDQSI